MNTNFLGIPVHGDIVDNEKRTTQRPIEELAPLMMAVLNDPTIKAFGWGQYTPYFNDGEPCVFSVNQPWFLTVNDPDPEDMEDEDQYTIETYGDGHPTLGKREHTWTGRWPNRENNWGEYTGTDAARYDRCRHLSEAIESEAFDNVLLAAFGDHARIAVRATGITVDTYEHD